MSIGSISSINTVMVSNHIFLGCTSQEEFRNVRCAVCSYLVQEDKKSLGTRQRQDRKIGRTAIWCPHPSCGAHACREHRNDVHRLSLEGVNLAKFHKESRVAHTQNNPGRHKKPEGSGRKSK